MNKKKLISISLISFLITAIVFYSLFSYKKTHQNVGQQNAFISTDIYGKSIDVAKLDGIVILHFWATWCKPCITEFPTLINFMKKFDKRVYLIAISSDSDSVIIHNFLKNYNTSQLSSSYIIRDEGNHLQKKFFIKMLPTTLILDKDKIVLKRISGEVEWSDPRLHEIIEKLTVK